MLPQSSFCTVFLPEGRIRTTPSPEGTFPPARCAIFKHRDAAAFPET
jgi:hypothetical protein